MAQVDNQLSEHFTSSDCLVKSNYECINGIANEAYQYQYNSLSDKGPNCLKPVCSFLFSELSMTKHKPVLATAWY